MKIFRNQLKNIELKTLYNKASNFETKEMSLTEKFVEVIGKFS